MPASTAAASRVAVDDQRGTAEAARSERRRCRARVRVELAKACKTTDEKVHRLEDARQFAQQQVSERLVDFQVPTRIAAQIVDDDTAMLIVVARARIARGECVPE